MKKANKHPPPPLQPSTLPLDAKRRATPTPVAFRLLCPVDRIGALIGRGGDVIATLRAATGARVKLDPPAPRCRDRVLHVSAGPGAATGAACPATAALLAAHDRLTHGDGGEGGDVSSPPPTATHAEARLLVDAGLVGALLGRRGAAIQALRVGTGACVRVLPAKELPAVAAPGDELVRIAGAPPAVAAALARVAATLRATPPRRVGGGPAGLMPPPTDLVAALGAAGLGPTAEWEGTASPSPRRCVGAAAPTCWPDAGSADAEPGSPASPMPLVLGLLPPALEALLAGPASPTRAGAAAASCPCRSSAGSAAFAASPLARRPAAAMSAALWTSGEAAAASSQPTTPLSSGSPSAATATTITYRLLVPAQAVGAVLGPGGATVRRLRETGAWVKIHPAPRGAAVRVVQASSSAAPTPSSPTCPASVALVTAVGLLLADGGAGRARHAVRLLAPRRDAVAALAAGGGPPALSAATGAAVSLDRPDSVGCPALSAALAGRDDAVVTIDGGAAAVAGATQLVAALLRGVAVRAAAAAATATPSSSSLGQASLPPSPLCGAASPPHQLARPRDRRHSHPVSVPGRHPHPLPARRLHRQWSQCACAADVGWGCVYGRRVAWWRSRRRGRARHAASFPVGGGGAAVGRCMMKSVRVHADAVCLFDSVFFWFLAPLP